MTSTAPQKRRVMRMLLALAALLLGLAGCTDNVWQGQVATINGRPITLAQVSALRNSTYSDWVASPTADIDDMRKQYGDALTNLLAVELVKQHLEKKKLEITDEELQTQEEVIRSDYPPGTFEDTLVSEGIDLETWRFLLRNYLSVQRLLDKVLRPEIAISPEEASAYLEAHPKEFIRPPWAYFFLISGFDGNEVAACGKALDETGDPARVQEAHPDTIIRTVRMDIPRLDPALAGEVSGLRPGDLSRVMQVNGEYHQALLLEILPERQAEPREAYLQIEEILMARKLNVAYNEWVLGRLRKASIKVSQQLLPHLRKSGAISETHGNEGGEPSPAS